MASITDPIIIGDDYLAANDRAITLTVDEVQGITAGTATCQLGVSHPSKGSFLVSGALTDNGDSTWTLSFDVTRHKTDDLQPGEYAWSAQVTDAAGIEVTVARNDDNCAKVELVSKQA